ncbi:hypothetical protein NQZ68_025131 [Dissostichus eleginoides]|nr:hypothetical protein NQZ68_025131 [Dissostichus eleginoides]
MLCYVVTGGVRICFTDYLEFGLSRERHLTYLLPCRSSQESYSIYPQALIPLLMEFQKSSEGVIVVLWKLQEVDEAGD